MRARRALALALAPALAGLLGAGCEAKPSAPTTPRAEIVRAFCALPWPMPEDGPPPALGELEALARRHKGALAARPGDLPKVKALFRRLGEPHALARAARAQAKALGLETCPYAEAEARAVGPAPSEAEELTALCWEMAATHERPFADAKSALLARQRVADRVVRTDAGRAFWSKLTQAPAGARAGLIRARAEAVGKDAARACEAWISARQAGRTSAPASPPAVDPQREEAKTP